MRIFITGGAGKVGQRLLPQLQNRGDQVVLLTRNASQARIRLGPGYDYVEGDPSRLGPWMDAINGCDAVINLVGEYVLARRWTDAFKQVLRESRIKSTENVVAAIRKAERKPAVLIQASAIGYYGFHEDEELDESSPPGDDFLARLCTDWENAARPVEVLGVRLVLIRTGVVLDNAAGPLVEMMKPFKLFMGGPVGFGRQWVSWIHYADEVGLILWALDHEQVRGPINATAPEPVTNRQLSKALGAVMHRPSFMLAPPFALHILLGEAACLLTRGQRVLPKRAQQLGYQFQYPNLDGTLKHLVAKS